MKGYELLITATKGGKALGRTRLRFKPGKVPALTVRADPVLARPGQKITVRLLRGPGFKGAPPRRVRVLHLGDELKVLKRPKEAPASAPLTYTLPAGKAGWFTFSARGNRALVFVRAGGSLSVSIKPDKARYPPGATARLRIQTRAGGRGVRAAVGLFGVDETLSQLAPLAGPDALGGLRPRIKMKARAFGVLDAQALGVGRIRGKYAAEATVLRVAKIPTPAQLDAKVDASAQTQLDPNAQLTDRFYVVLAQLHRAARRWEKQAPAGELMTPATLARMWEQALKESEAAGQQVVDAFGRRLRLHRLPDDLLALTDPRQVVTVGTRLPEDVEDWPSWVARRKP